MLYCFFLYRRNHYDSFLQLKLADHFFPDGVTEDSAEVVYQLIRNRLGLLRVSVDCFLTDSVCHLQWPWLTGRHASAHQSDIIERR